VNTARRDDARLLVATGVVLAAGSAFLPAPASWIALPLLFAWLGLIGPRRFGYLVRASAWLLAALLLPSLLIATLQTDGALSSRLSLVVLTGSAGATILLGSRGLGESERRPPFMGLGQLSVGLAAFLVIVDSYFLHGTRGWLSGLGQDHLFHGALVQSFIESKSSFVELLKSAPDELAYVPSGLHASVASWFDLMLGARDVTVDTRLAVQVAVPLIFVVISWLVLWSAVSFATVSARGTTSRTCEVAASVTLAVLFAGPFLWLRASGMWPALISISALALACVLVVNGTSRSSFSVSRDPWSVAGSGTAVAVAVMAWPLMAVPIALAILVGLWFMLRSPTRVSGGLRRNAISGLVVCSIGSLGLVWTAATLRRPEDPLSGGQGGLGVLDYRWLVIALIATLAVPSIQRRLGLNLSLPAWVVLGSGVSIVVCGLMLDVVQSTIFDTTGTYYSNKLILLGLMIVLPVIVWGVVQPLESAENGRAVPRRALLSSALLLTALASLWFPWGAGSWVPYSTTGFFPAVGHLINVTFGSRSLVSDEARQDALWALCTKSMIIRYPPDSRQEGAPRHASSWSQVLAGRTNQEDWDAFKLVYPQFDQQITVADLRYWLDVAIADGAEGAITLVVPANLEAEVVTEVSAVGLGGAVEMRVETPEALREECGTRNG
jgi:hypothetical protein